MSMSVGELFGTLELDDKRFDQGLTGAGREFDQFSDDLDRDLRALAEEFDRQAAAAVAEMEQHLAQLAGVTDEAFAAAEREAAAGAEEIARRVETGIEEGIDGAVDAARRGGEQIGDRLERGIEDGLDDAERSARSAGESIGDEVGGGLESSADAGGQRAGAGMMAAVKGAGVLAAAAAAAAIADTLMRGFEQALANEVPGDILAAQLDLTAEQSARAGQVAGDLYVQAYGESMAEVDKAVGAVLSSFQWLKNGSTAELEDVTAAAMDFAKTFEIEVDRAVLAAGTALQAGLVDDAKHAFDLMTVASQRVPSAIREDLLDAVHEYGQFFNTLGFNGEQAFGLLVNASAKGTYGLDKMGDSLKEFTLLSTDLGSSSVTDAYKAIGLNAEEMSNKILAGGDTAQEAFQKIVRGLSEIKDPTEQATAAIGLFGTPLEDLNKGEIPEFLDQLMQVGGGLDDVAGAADRMGSTLADNAATKIETWKRSMEQGVVEFIGGEVIPRIEQLIEWLKMSGVADAIGAVVGKGKELIGSIVDSIRNWADQNQEQVDRIVDKAKWLFEEGSKYFGDLIDFAKELWEGGGEELISSIATKIEGILEILGGLVEGSRGIFLLLKGILTGDSTAIMEGLKAIWDGGMKVLEGLLDNLLGSIVELFGGNWDEVKQKTRDAIDKLVEFGRSLPGRLMESMASLGGRLVSWAVESWSSMRVSAIQKASELVDWVRELPGKITGALGDLGRLLRDAGSRVIQGLIDGLKAGFQRVKDTLANLTSMLPDWKGPADVDARLLTDNGRLIMQSLVDGFRASEGEVEHYLGDLTRRMGSMTYPGPSVDIQPYGEDGDPFSVTRPRGAPGEGGPMVNIENYNEAGLDVEDVGADLYWRAQGGGG